MGIGTRFRDCLVWFPRASKEIDLNPVTRETQLGSEKIPRNARCANEIVPAHWNKQLEKRADWNTG